MFSGVFGRHSEKHIGHGQKTTTTGIPRWFNSRCPLDIGIRGWLFTHLSSPLWLQVSVRSSTRGSWAYEPADKKIYLSSNGPRPRPENCTTGCFALTLLELVRPTTTHRRNAPPGASRDRVSRQGTESLATNARSTDGGHRGRGRRILVEENWTLFFFLSFSLSLCVLSFWLPRRRVWGTRALPPSPLLGASVKKCAAIVYEYMRV